MNRVLQQRMTQISRQNNFNFCRNQDQQEARQTHGGDRPGAPQGRRDFSRDADVRQLR